MEDFPGFIILSGGNSGGGGSRALNNIPAVFEKGEKSPGKPTPGGLLSGEKKKKLIKTAHEEGKIFLRDC